MSALDQVVQFPYASIQFLADSNQCQQLDDESIKYLTLETTDVIRTCLQVSGKNQVNIFGELLSI
jgi:hypothetical protein